MVSSSYTSSCGSVSDVGGSLGGGGWWALYDMYFQLHPIKSSGAQGRQPLFEFLYLIKHLVAALLEIDTDWNEIQLEAKSFLGLLQ